MSTRIALVEAVAAFLEEVTTEMRFYARHQKSTDEPYLPMTVYRLRLPNAAEAEKKTPYILVQYLSSSTSQTAGRPPETLAVVRLVIAVANPDTPEGKNSDDQEGMYVLLELIDRLHFHLEQQIVLDDAQRDAAVFELCLDEPMEDEIFYSDTRPYCVGWMTTVWRVGTATRKDVQALI